jgi:hypothetical protein
VWLAYSATPAIDPSLYLNDVKFLASPELKGRATGSPELEKAAAFIAGKFREFGLKGPGGKGLLPAFQATTATRLGKANHLRFQENGRTTTAAIARRFHSVQFLASRQVERPGGLRRLWNHGRAAGV